MTERQAWQKLARRMKAGIDLCCGGLCCEVGALKLPPLVDESLRATLRKLPKTHLVNGAEYTWSLGPSGKRARIAFCARQVARLTRKRVSPKKARR